jgi:hypothetical protein
MLYGACYDSAGRVTMAKVGRIAKSIRKDTGEPPKKAFVLRETDRHLLAAYVKGKSYAETVRILEKQGHRGYATNESGIATISKRIKLLKARILEEYGPDGWWEVLGVTDGDIAQVVRDGLQADTVREWYDSKTGQVVAGEVRPDHKIRVETAKLVMQARGDLKPGESDALGSGANVQVNIINYAPPGATWPPNP